MKSSFPWSRWLLITLLIASFAVFIQLYSTNQSFSQTISRTIDQVVDVYQETTHKHVTGQSTDLSSTSLSSKQTTNPTIKDDVTGYVVLVDAGSSGTRVHVHKYLINQSDNQSKLPIIYPSDSLKVKPGMSHFTSVDRSNNQLFNPATNQTLKQSLQPLIDFATEHVPSEKQSKTPIYCFATAGLRLLSIDQSESILSDVRSIFQSTNFQYHPSQVRIISGVQEGINGWIAANYLLGNFNQSDSQSNNQSTLKPSDTSNEQSNEIPIKQSIDTTVGVLEMGGASFQLTYAPKRWNSQLTSQLISLSIGSQSFQIYTMSYLNFGLEMAQELYHDIVHQSNNHSENESVDQTISHILDPCYPRGLNQSNSFIASNWLDHRHSHGHYEQCTRLVDRLIRRDLSIKQHIKETFNHTSNQPVDLSIHRTQEDEWENPPSHSSSTPIKQSNSEANTQTKPVVQSTHESMKSSINLLISPAIDQSIQESNDNDTAHHEPGHLIDCSVNQCAFNQSFIPTISPSEKFIAIENFFYTAEFFGLVDQSINPSNDQSVPMDLQSFKQKGREFCSLQWDEIQSAYPSEPRSDLEKYCFSSVYLPRVIEIGLGLIDQPIDQSVDRTIDQSIKETIDQSINDIEVDIDQSLIADDVSVIKSHTTIHVDQSSNESINQSNKQSNYPLNVHITRSINGVAIDWALGAVLLEITNHIHSDLFDFQSSD